MSFLFFFLVLFALCSPQQYHPAVVNSRLPLSSWRSPLSPLSSSSPVGSQGIWQRRLQQPEDENTAIDGCSLCSDAPVLQNLYPYYDSETLGGTIPSGLSCNDLEVFASGNIKNQEQCIGLRIFLAESCCDLPRSYYECATNVKNQIIHDNTGYDTTIAPATRNTPVVNVTLVLEFLHISELDIRLGTLEIFAFVNLRWKDERLAWNFTSETCAQTVSVRASMNAEVTEIWVPDFDLYNRAHGLQDMDETMAEVFPDGTVLWRRNGSLKALCTFSGLAQLPYDTIGCRFIMGGWTDQRLVAMVLAPNPNNNDNTNQDGFLFPVTIEKNYVQYSLETDLVETGYWTVGGRTAQSIVYYDFYFARSTSYYIFKFVIPNIFYTFLSFGVFLLDMRVGERLSYGISVLLVNVASDIVTQQYLPVTDQRLWLDVLIGASFYWILFGLIESVFVGYLFFLYDSDSDEEVEIKHHNDSKNDDDDDDNRRHISQPRHPQEEKEEKNCQGSDDNDFVEDPSGEMYVVKKEPEISSPSYVVVKPEKKRYMFATLRQQMRARPRAKLKIIRKIDMFFFVVIPSTYVIFLLFMFVGDNKYFLPNEELPFPGNTDTSVEQDITNEF